MDSQKDYFLLTCIIMIDRKYTRTCFITRPIVPKGCKTLKIGFVPFTQTNTKIIISPQSKTNCTKLAHFTSEQVQTTLQVFVNGS